MSKQKLRGISDRELAAILNQNYQRTTMLVARALKQRGYNRTVGVAVVLLYVLAMGQTGWFDSIIATVKGWW